MEEEGSTKPKKRAKRIRSEATKLKDKQRSKIWNSNLLQSKKDLENKVQTLQQENNELQQQLDKMKAHLELLVEENTRLHEFGMETKGKIVHNCRRLVNDLPSNSPYRRPILAYLMEGLEQRKALEVFQISARTYGRIHEDIGNSLIETKYTVGVTKTRVSQEQIEEIQRILDDILPKQSGREWRTQEMTKTKLYETYCAEVQKGGTVSKQFFVYTILAAERIHRSRPKFCPLCELYASEETSVELVHHKELIPLQRGQYTKEKLSIASEKTPTTTLVTQDFSQVIFEGGFVQDLIICFYSYDKEATDGLKRLYRHFVGRTADKNDISFVVGCWKILLEEHRFENMETVSIWSDGGPKHFKISANIRFILSLQQARPDINWIYNFFPSYHGCSICDGVASQAKQAIKRSMGNEQIAIRTAEQVVSVIDNLNNHQATMATVTSTNLSANTLHGIKKYHKFTTSKEKNVIYAYSDSTQTEYAHKYMLRDVVSLDDILVQ
jgi:cell division protein FtsB